MKITELDFTKEGKRYRCCKIIFEIKDGDLINIESNAYLRDANISMAELSKMDFEEIEEMKNPYKQAGYGEKYHYIWGFSLNSNTDLNYEIDNKLFLTANYFNNKEYARYIAFKETLMRRMDRFAWEHNAKVINWDDSDSAKYCIKFSDAHNKFIIEWSRSYQLNDIYFTSKEIAAQAIEEFKDDLIKLYTWRFDV